MATDDQNKNNSGKRGRRRGRRRRSNSQKNPQDKRGGIHPEALAAIPKPAKRELSSCPLCDKSVREIQSAIAYGEDEKPAHLECVLNELKTRESLDPDERLCYIGAGRFAVIKSKIGKDGLEVIRTIQYEDRERVIGWRREQSPGLSRASVDDPVGFDERLSHSGHDDRSSSPAAQSDEPVNGDLGEAGRSETE